MSQRVDVSAGDSNAVYVKELYRKYRKRIIFIVSCYARSQEDREDLFQTVFMKIVQNVDAIRAVDASKEEPYISMIAKNTSLNYVRHEALVREHSIPDSAELDEPCDTCTSEEHVLMKESREQMRACINSLREQDQVLLIGKYVLERSNRELAAEVGCRPEVVSTKIIRAKSRLRSIVRKEGYHDEP